MAWSRRSVLRVAGSVASTSLAGCTTTRPLTPLVPARITREMWAEDLEAIVAGIGRLHANPWHTISRAAFRAEATAVRRRIAQQESSASLVDLTRLAARIGDGHTRLMIEPVFRYFPFALGWFDEGRSLRVIGVDDRHAELWGARLRGAGGDPFDRLRVRVAELVPAGETQGFVDGWVRTMLCAGMVHGGLGLAPSDDRQRFVFESMADRREREIELEVFDPHAPPIWWDPRPGRPPLSALGEGVWVQHEVPERRAIYVRLATYAKSDLGRPARALRRLAERGGADSLILDLRACGGGDLDRFRDTMLTWIVGHERFDRPGHLFVLIGRGSFSAAVANAADLRRETHAILVGQPTGGRPRGYQERGGLVLPRSRLELSVAVAYHAFTKEDTPGLLPDRTIETTWEDWNARRDPVLDFVWAQLSGG